MAIKSVLSTVASLKVMLGLGGETMLAGWILVRLSWKCTLPEVRGLSLWTAQTDLRLMKMRDREKDGGGEREVVDKATVRQDTPQCTTDK